jgi:hypothetical protein
MSQGVITYYDPAIALAAATTDLRYELEALARRHPTVDAGGAVVGGQLRGVLVLATDAQGNYVYSPSGRSV